MFRDVLESQQPVVFRTLGNALRKKQVSHCYLFTGPKGSFQMETAILLAQSVICSESDSEWACEECIECLQVGNKEYADMLVLDGSKETIKIDQINKLQSQFSQTALSKAGYKVFIINDCENMTGKAANSLLKFIEEPSSNTLGIFITSAVNRVLPTIVSRCQQVAFKPLSSAAFNRQAIDEGIDPIDAHLISIMANNQAEIEEIRNSESYQAALKYFIEFMNYYFADYSEGLLYLQDNGFKTNPRSKDNKTAREVFSYFLRIATIFVNDFHSNIHIDDQSWDDLLEKAHESRFNSRNYLEAVSETRDALIRSANISLLIDQLLYKLSGGINDK